MKRPQVLHIETKADFKKVPTHFSGLIGNDLIGKTVVISEPDERKVLTLKKVERAMKSVSFNAGQTVFLVSNLTQEAMKFLNENGIRVKRTSNFAWTDESWENIKH